MLWLAHDIKDQLLLEWWEEVKWFHESRFSLAVKNMVRSSQRECRNVLEKWKFDTSIDVLVELGQCGVISSCKETFGGHLKRIHFAVVITDVSCEMCIFVGYLSVPLLNIIFFSEGHESSNKWMVFSWSFRITMSGFRVVTPNSGGMEPPTEAVCPGRSLKTLNFGSTFVTI